MSGAVPNIHEFVPLLAEQKVDGKATSSLLNVEAEGILTIGCDGVVHLSLDVPAAYVNTFDAHASIRIQYSGNLADGRRFQGSGFLANNFEYTWGAPTARWHLAFGNIEVYSASMPESSGASGSRLRISLVNFPFKGEMARTIQKEQISETRRDTFLFTAFGRQWTVHQHPEYEPRLQALEKGLMRKCVTAEMLVCVGEGASTDSIKTLIHDECEVLEWLFSISSGSRVLSCAWSQEDDNGNVLWTEYADRITPEYKHAWPAVDNAPEHGLRIAEFIEKAHKVFSSEKELALPLFVDWILQSLRSLPLELKVLSAILALEHLTARYAIVRMGATEDQMEDRNVVEKLKFINGNMKFVPAALTGDRLRKDVRNPLVHSGRVLGLNARELEIVHRELLNLGFQLFSRIVGYDGLYFNPAKEFAPERVPAPR